MKNLLKNIIIGLLVIAAVIVVPSVFATVIENENTTGHIIVNGLEKNIDVTAYRLMTVKIVDGQPQSPVYTWDSRVAKWLQNYEDKNGNKIYAGYVGDDNAVAESFNSSINAAKFYDDLAAAIRADKTAATEGKTPAYNLNTLENVPVKANSEGTADLEVKMGNYLVLVENGSRVYKPMAANVVPEYKDGKWNVKDGEIIKDTVLNAKSSKPGIEKEVSSGKTSDSVKVGDVLTYTLKINVPKYPEGTTNKTLKVGDVFSTGLDYVGIVSVVADKTADLVKDTNYTAEYDEAKRTLEINFGGDMYDANKNYTTIVVTYKAKVNDTALATDEINNTATLTYNNNPYKDNDSATDTDKVTVYTYGIKIKKIGTEDKDKNGLAGVIFNITNAAGKTLCFKANDNGYTYAGEKDGSCPNGSSVDVVTPEGGLLVINGLDEGVYKATETFAPDGYIKLKSALTFTIKDADADGKVDGTLEKVENDVTIDGRYVLRNVENSKSLIDLPVTGGIGTILFSIIGILFMGGSIVLIKNILKKKEVQL